MTETNDLRDLPNVRLALARDLLAAGVGSAVRLRELAARAARERAR